MSKVEIGVKWVEMELGWHWSGLGCELGGRGACSLGWVGVE